MAAAVRVRRDYEAAQIRVLAKRSKNAAQTRRLLALAAIYDGGSRTEAARIGGVGLQTVRDWVLAFNAEGPPGLVNGKAPGNAPLINDQQRQALHRIVESGPLPAVHGVVRWRLIDLAHGCNDHARSPGRRSCVRLLRFQGSGSRLGADPFSLNRSSNISLACTTNAWNLRYLSCAATFAVPSAVAGAGGETQVLAVAARNSSCALRSSVIL